MPSLKQIVKRGDRVEYNSQAGQIVVPPLMKCVNAGDQLGTSLEVLPGDPNKVYIIHAVIMFVSNDAGTTASYLAMYFNEYSTGKWINFPVYLSPSTVNQQSLSISGLNQPCMPGQPIYIICDAAPKDRTVRVFYSEVLLN